MSLTTVKEMIQVELHPVRGLEDCAIVMNREVYKRPVLGHYIVPPDDSPRYWPTRPLDQYRKYEVVYQAPYMDTLADRLGKVLMPMSDM